MKLVLDTNIFISAFFWGGYPREVFERVLSGLDELYISEGIMRELASVLTGGKFAVNGDEVEDYLQIIKKYSNEVI
ncbi:MAG: PIN domain-containing protein [Treponema sp.]|nr:PIN domain-containing protein [Treponema sp.]